MGNRSYRHRVTDRIGEFADSVAHQFRDVLEEVDASSRPGRHALPAVPVAAPAPIATDSQEAE